MMFRKTSLGLDLPTTVQGLPEKTDEAKVVPGEEPWYASKLPGDESDDVAVAPTPEEK